MLVAVLEQEHGPHPRRHPAVMGKAGAVLREVGEADAVQPLLAIDDPRVETGSRGGR